MFLPVALIGICGTAVLFFLQKACTLVQIRKKRRSRRLDFASTASTVAASATCMVRFP